MSILIRCNEHNDSHRSARNPQRIRAEVTSRFAKKWEMFGLKAALGRLGRRRVFLDRRRSTGAPVVWSFSERRQDSTLGQLIISSWLDVKVVPWCVSPGRRSNRPRSKGPAVLEQVVFTSRGFTRCELCRSSSRSTGFRISLDPEHCLLRFLSVWATSMWLR